MAEVVREWGGVILYIEDFVLNITEWQHETEPDFLKAHSGNIPGVHIVHPKFPPGGNTFKYHRNWVLENTIKYVQFLVYAALNLARPQDMERVRKESPQDLLMNILDFNVDFNDGVDVAEDIGNVPDDFLELRSDETNGLPAMLNEWMDNIRRSPPVNVESIVTEICMELFSEAGVESIIAGASASDLPSIIFQVAYEVGLAKFLAQKDGGAPSGEGGSESAGRYPALHKLLQVLCKGHFAARVAAEAVPGLYNELMAHRAEHGVGPWYTMRKIPPLDLADGAVAYYPCTRETIDACLRNLSRAVVFRFDREGGQYILEHAMVRGKDNEKLLRVCMAPDHIFEIVDAHAAFDPGSYIVAAHRPVEHMQVQPDALPDNGIRARWMVDTTLAWQAAAMRVWTRGKARHVHRLARAAMQLAPDDSELSEWKVHCVLGATRAHSIHLLYAAFLNRTGVWPLVCRTLVLAALGDTPRTRKSPVGDRRLYLVLPAADVSVGAVRGGESSHHGPGSSGPMDLQDADRSSGGPSNSGRRGALAEGYTSEQFRAEMERALERAVVTPHAVASKALGVNQKDKWMSTDIREIGVGPWKFLEGGDLDVWAWYRECEGYERAMRKLWQEITDQWTEDPREVCRRLEKHVLHKYVWRHANPQRLYHNNDEWVGGLPGSVDDLYAGVRCYAYATKGVKLPGEDDEDLYGRCDALVSAAVERLGILGKPAFLDWPLPRLLLWGAATAGPSSSEGTKEIVRVDPTHMAHRLLDLSTWRMLLEVQYAFGVPLEKYNPCVLIAHKCDGVDDIARQQELMPADAAYVIAALVDRDEEMLSTTARLAKTVVERHRDST